MFLRSVAFIGLIALSTSAWPQEIGPQEIKKKVISRADVSGTNLEVVMTETEIPPGAVSPRHTHPGEEAFYVIEGAMTEMPGKPAIMREAGTGGINARDVPHAGYKVVGDKTLKIVNVYIVDKGKPISVPAPDK